MSEEIGANVSWNKRLEDYFSGTGEKAHCLSLLHKKAEAVYSRRRNFIDLPVIVGSAIIGFLNAGSSSMFQDQMIASISLGVGSLVVGVLQTVNAYFQWSKRAEGHRITAIQYAKLYRFLNIEMSLPRNERMTPKELLRHTKDAYDRLQEISPLLPPEIIQTFKREFNRPEYKDITLPEEANGLEKIVVYDEAGTPTSFLSSPNPVYRLPAERKTHEAGTPSAREPLDTYQESQQASQP
jgi:hypothetical protein